MVLDHLKFLDCSQRELHVKFFAAMQMGGYQGMDDGSKARVRTANLSLRPSCSFLHVLKTYSGGHRDLQNITGCSGRRGITWNQVKKSYISTALLMQDSSTWFQMIPLPISSLYNPNQIFSRFLLSLWRSFSWNTGVCRWEEENIGCMSYHLLMQPLDTTQYP